MIIVTTNLICIIFPRELNFEQILEALDVVQDQCKAI